MFSYHRTIAVWPEHIRGGINTLLSLSRLFNAPLDVHFFGQPIEFLLGDMSEEDVEVLRELIREETICQSS